MSGWNDLVTTALLGTDRRPLPTGLAGPLAALDARLDEPDPAARLLDLAAGYAAMARVAGRLPDCPPAPTAPGQPWPEAPPPAQQLLAELLALGQPTLVDDWLSRSIAHRLSVAPRLWAQLLSTARTRGCDQRLVAEAVGPRGRFFASHHPQWRRVSLVRPQPAAGEAAEEAPVPSVLTATEVVERLAGRPVEGRQPAAAAMELLLTCTESWTPELVDAGLALIGGGLLTQPLVSRFAVRMPLAGYPAVGRVAGSCLFGPDRPTAAVLQSAWHGFVQVEELLHQRIRVHNVFEPQPYPAARTLIPRPY
ncbi:hypothetical protein GCM10009841_28960 [Microlunatus panaciterrae]|uniref:Uncharacterized protein n=1 Tax=Microlunatus panaciterrae TaxID=400768 RepID=A0ABS2REX8_9ACTN|nr:hypothetical protein [Microlunatus panaciterrae]MBM7797556.1 hypothetical protein [Microlunatus panaciterrae]